MAKSNRVHTHLIYNCILSSRFSFMQNEDGNYYLWVFFFSSSVVIALGSEFTLFVRGIAKEKTNILFFFFDWEKIYNNCGKYSVHIKYCFIRQLVTLFCFYLVSTACSKDHILTTFNRADALSKVHKTTISCRLCDEIK